MRLDQTGQFIIQNIAVMNISRIISVPLFPVPGFDLVFTDNIRHIVGFVTQLRTFEVIHNHHFYRKQKARLHCLKTDM